MISMNTIFRLLIVTAISFFLWFLSHQFYQFGFSKGESSVQLKWDKANQEIKATADKIAADNLIKEADNRKRLEDISYELSEAKRVAAISLANQRTDYERRLRNSASRADYYFTMSQAGAAEQASLASHAARLDRAVEEGRYVVTDLRSVIELRDAQLIQLGKQILSDRALFASGTANGHR